MTVWWTVATVLVAASVLPLWVASRARTMDRLVALQVLAANVALVIVLVAVAAGRGVYLDGAVVLAVLTIAGGLTFARVLERWL